MDGEREITFRRCTLQTENYAASRNVDQWIQPENTLVAAIGRFLTADEQNG